jgi:hypothetical protein
MKRWRGRISLMWVFLPTTATTKMLREVEDSMMIGQFQSSLQPWAYEVVGADAVYEGALEKPGAWSKGGHLTILYTGKVGP